MDAGRIIWHLLKPMKKTATVFVSSGKVSSPDLMTMLRGLPDGSYKVGIEEEYRQRSPNQNAFYWWPFLDCLGECMGELIPEMDKKSRTKAKDTIHEFLKGKFLDQKVIKNPRDRRKKIKLTPSTANLSTREFEEMMEKARVFFGQWGWSLPYPNGDIPPHLLDPY